MKCPKCLGEGGFRQPTRLMEDDVAWDLCPMCNGKKVIDKKDAPKELLEDDDCMLIEGEED